MKKNSIIALFLLLSLAACTPYMYGVPQESWDRMSQPERIEAMRVYERNEQASRQAAEERARTRAIEEQSRRQAAEERARHEAREREQAQSRQAKLERERHERIREPEAPAVNRERDHRASIASTAPFISGRTLRWETDAQGGQFGTIHVTSTKGSSFYLDQKNSKNRAAGIIKLEGKIKDGKVFINNGRWNETWVGTLHNGTVSGKINNTYSFRISE